LILSLIICAMASTPITVDEVRTASRQSLDSIRAALDVEKAEVAKVTARSSILPHATLDFGISDTFAGPQRTFSTVPQANPDGTVSFVQRSVDTPAFSQGRFSLGIGVNQLLYDGGRWWNQIALAGHQEEAAKGQLAEQQLSSEFEGQRRFFVLLQAQLSLQVLVETKQRSEEQVDRAKTLFEAARGTRGQVLDAQTNVQSDAISIARQKQRIREARIALFQWLGKADEEVEAVAPSVNLTQKYAADSLLAQAKEHRPLFHSFYAQQKGAETQIELSKANFFPRVSLNAQYFRNSPSADPFFTDFTKQNAFSVGANLSWDLFNGFADEAQVNKSKVEQNSLAAQAKQALVDLQAEVTRTLSLLESEQEILVLSEASVQLAKEQVAFETERFKAGAGSNIEVRNAQLKLSQAELQKLQSQAQVLIAVASLERATGKNMKEIK
jgi:outer membrane protein